MENKGLNIFNSAYVLADPDTATDVDYENILGVIAHEYFHNWTGNRVTVRDWFQLTLKEGLTVFRDQVGVTSGGHSTPTIPLQWIEWHSACVLTYPYCPLHIRISCPLGH